MYIEGSPATSSAPLFSFPSSLLLPLLSSFPPILLPFFLAPPPFISPLLLSSSFSPFTPPLLPTPSPPSLLPLLSLYLLSPLSLSLTLTYSLLPFYPPGYCLSYDMGAYSLQKTHTHTTHYSNTHTHTHTNIHTHAYTVTHTAFGMLSQCHMIWMLLSRQISWVVCFSFGYYSSYCSVACEPPQTRKFYRYMDRLPLPVLFLSSLLLFLPSTLPSFLSHTIALYGGQFGTKTDLCTNPRV